MASLTTAPRERNSLLKRIGVAVDPDASDATRNPIKAIRRHCLDCSGGSARLVEECPAATCALFAFRLGVNPFRVAGRSSVGGALAPEVLTPLAMG